MSDALRGALYEPAAGSMPLAAFQNGDVVGLPPESVMLLLLK